VATASIAGKLQDGMAEGKAIQHRETQKLGNGAGLSWREGFAIYQVV